MNIFSNNARFVPATGVKPANQAVRIQALAEEYETQNLVANLDEIYRFADSLVDDRYACRKCARCCDQTIRPLAAYAVEIAYLARNGSADNIPIVKEDEPLCPALNEARRCGFYLKRPLGCRLFLPWEEWGDAKGCANYPHGLESIEKIHCMLSLVESLNHEFIRTLGLHRDFDFDYLAHWSITTWFAPLVSTTANTALSWGI